MDQKERKPHPFDQFLFRESGRESETFIPHEPENVENGQDDDLMKHLADLYESIEGLSPLFEQWYPTVKKWFLKE
ncbi:hypothetical protein Q73_03990 [Bacillus coahuilensis m2-6]|uniref:Uncharacterized protein n=1 Tax=Bacillus coahuilensis p1.1.43 TaxID=1150625 RepID=A0A147KA32_9BACI|nr:hypothetical protein [Bacillus coahuilensis]KUP07511.1 hypothetical protein Q75_04575 [Bacillus coahuilensis p1.1.43]KUP09071.1 hypothetical protein Q73_03990 [Bacillus coahuilensis m2-6]